MSFASEPGRDDGNLPPANIVVPDDARELDRDVLAYRREMRAKRRRERLTRLVRPLRASEFSGHAAIIPLIAICLAISLVGGALLSVVTMRPASAPTLGTQQTPVQPAPVSKLSTLPEGTVRLNRGEVRVRSLVTSAIALIPAGCDCDIELRRLADQALTAGVGLYFVGSGLPIGQVDPLVARDGEGKAVAAADDDNVLTRAYNPVGLTVLLVFRDQTAEVRRNLAANFELGPELNKLGQDGASRSTTSPTGGASLPGIRQPAGS